MLTDRNEDAEISQLVELADRVATNLRLLQNGVATARRTDPRHRVVAELGMLRTALQIADDKLRYLSKARTPAKKIQLIRS